MKSTRRRHLLQTALLVTAGMSAPAERAVGRRSRGHRSRSRRRSFPISGSSDLFPVRRIYCIGRNYAAHAREMGSDPTREPPFFFQKPTDAVQIVPPGVTVDHPYPSLTKNYHYEIELVAALERGRARYSRRAGAGLRVRLHGRPGHDAARPAARDGRREEAMGDRQELRPFGAARTAAACGEDRAVHAKARSGSRSTGRSSSHANLNQMIWSVAEQISKLSQAFELMPGDIIYLGDAGKRRTGGQGRRHDRSYRPAAGHQRKVV